MPAELIPTNCFTPWTTVLLPTEIAAIQVGARTILEMHQGPDKTLFETAAGDELTRLCRLPKEYDVQALLQSFRIVGAVVGPDKQRVFEPAVFALERIADPDAEISTGGPASLIGTGAAIMAGLVEMPTIPGLVPVDDGSFSVQQELWRRVDEMFRSEALSSDLGNLVQQALGGSQFAGLICPVRAGQEIFNAAIGDPYFALRVAMHESEPVVTVRTLPLELPAVGFKGDELQLIANERANAALTGIRFMLGQLGFLRFENWFEGKFPQWPIPIGDIGARLRQPAQTRTYPRYDRLYIETGGVTVMLDGRDFNILPPIPDGELPKREPRAWGGVVQNILFTPSATESGSMKYTRTKLASGDPRADHPWISDEMTALRREFADGIDWEHALVDTAMKLGKALSPSGRVLVSQNGFLERYSIQTDKGTPLFYIVRGKRPFAVLEKRVAFGFDGKNQFPKFKIVFNSRGEVAYRMASDSHPNVVSLEYWPAHMSELPVFRMAWLALNRARLQVAAHAQRDPVAGMALDLLAAGARGAIIEALKRRLLK